MKPRPSCLLIRLVCLIALLTLPACVSGRREPPPRPRLIVLDVGEGQAVLLTHGHHGLLVDSGRTGMGRRILERLRHYGIRALDTVVYTHLHPDHAGSWFRIHEAFPKVRVIENGQRKPDRKSTRLNSSHVAISYAVFFLKKKVSAE